LGFKTPNEVFMQSLNRVALSVWIYLFILSIGCCKKEIESVKYLFQVATEWR
jgi:hypothetical protein